MSYAFGNLIYGIPVAEALWDKATELAEEEYGGDTKEYLEGLGFTMLYTSGGGEPFEPGYLGVDLKEIDECHDVKFSELEEAKRSLSKVKADELREKFDALPDELKEVAESIDFWLVWSSS